MKEFIVGVVLGGGVVAIGKKVYRPAIKEAIKFGLTASVVLKNAFHEGRERLMDLVAEARHEAEIEAARRAREDREAQPAS
jgi:hypothetical protein